MQRDPTMTSLRQAQLETMTTAVSEAASSELRRRLEEVARTQPSVAREVSYVDALLCGGHIDDLSADWCRRLKLPVRAANRRKVIVVEKEICGRRGERLVEVDRVVFDEQLQEGAPGGDVWLEVALVCPAERPSHHLCWVSTRFSLVDKKVCATVAEVQCRWSQRFGVPFFEQREVKPYVYSPRSGTVTRAYGAQSRFEIAGDAARVYQYLDIIAHAWDWQGPGAKASARTVRRGILENTPQLALDLFADPSKSRKLNRPGSEDERPKLNVELIARVGQALGYISASGARRTKGKARPADGEIDKRLLPLIAKILAQKHKKPAATLLRTVVRPALLHHAFEGFGFESAERIVRPRRATHRRRTTPAQKRQGELRGRKN